MKIPNFARSVWQPAIWNLFPYRSADLWIQKAEDKLKGILKILTNSNRRD